MAVDLEMLKDIPGYKAILKSVIKSQIQMLLEQLSCKTGEESLILTASVDDGTFSHLGTTNGKGFLDGRDDVKSQFLGYCIKIHHQPKVTVEENVTYPNYNASPRLSVQHTAPLKCASPRHAVQKATSSKWPRYNPLSRPTSAKAKPNNQKKLHEASSMAQSEAFTASTFSPSTSIDPELPVKSELQLDTSVVSELNFTGDLNTNTTSNSYPTSTDNYQHALSLDSSAVKLEPAEDDDLEIIGIEMNSSSNFHGNGSQDDEQGQNDAEHDMSIYNDLMPNVGDTSQSSQYQLHDQSDISPESTQRLSRLQCDFCTKVFRQRSDKMRHMRIHTGEKPYVCSFCKACFRLKHHLKNHIFNMHDLKQTQQSINQLS